MEAHVLTAVIHCINNTETIVVTLMENVLIYGFLNKFRYGFWMQNHEPKTILSSKTILEINETHDFLPNQHMNWLRTKEKMSMEKSTSRKRKLKQWEWKLQIAFLKQ